METTTRRHEKSKGWNSNAVIREVAETRCGSGDALSRAVARGAVKVIHAGAGPSVQTCRSRGSPRRVFKMFSVALDVSHALML